jgi:hypothetical protein
LSEESNFDGIYITHKAALHKYKTFLYRILNGAGRLKRLKLQVYSWNSPAMQRVRFSGLQDSRCRVQEVEVGALCHEVLAFLRRQSLTEVVLTDDFASVEDLSR